MKKYYSLLRVALSAVMMILLTAESGSAQGFTSVTNLNSLTVSAITGEKPQSKVWTYAGRWWMVMPNSSGTQIWRLDGTTWTSVLNISASTSTFADCKAVGSVTHILLYQGTSSSLVSVEYVPVSNTYQLWTTRTSTVPITLDGGVETATIDIDGNGRMWLANSGTSEVNVRWSDSPYSIWSSPITLATGIDDDDICAITSFNGNIGVLWSNQNSDRFGFRYHVAGADPATWSTAEVPASQSAISFGAGMADDHLNFAVASDGTIYAAVKTSYDATGYPRIALLIRRPGGTWDDLYEVSQTGTRGIVILNEAAGKVKVIFTASDAGGNILYRESPTSAISFGSVNTLISGGTYNNATSMKQNYSGDVVILAGTGSSLASVLATDAIPGLVAHWKMNENTGATTLTDASGIGNNATSVTGSPTFVSGVEANAISLSGTNQYATVPDAVSLDITNTITMAAWIKCSKTTAATQRIIAKTVMNATNGYELSLASTGRVFARFNQQTSTDTYRVNSGTTYSLNGSAWMHVAATYDGSYIRIYINGVQDAISSTVQTFTIASNDIPLEIGRQNDGTNPYYYAGEMDEVYLFNRALSASEILALATGYEPVAPGLTSPANLASGIATTPTLSWNAGSGATSYQIQVSSTANFSDIVFDQSGITTTSTAVTPELSNNTVYYWRVNATNAVGTGLWSQVWSFTTVGLPSIPPAPALVAPSNSAYSVVVTPILRWNASAGAVSYQVQVSETPDFLAPIFDQSGLAAVTATVTPALSNNTTYYWRVNATNTAGTSVWSPVWTFTTLASTPAIENNGAGYALDFDGLNDAATTDYVNCGNAASLNITQSLTIEAWVRPSARKTHSVVKKFLTGGTVGYEIFLEGPSPYRVSARLNNSSTYRVNSTTPYPIDGTWIHVAAVYDYTSNPKTFKLYINGIQEASITGPGLIGTTTNPLTIGSELSDFSKGFQGLIDEVRVWNITRSDADIKANMTRKLVGNETGLVGYWRFDETYGTLVNDETSNNNDGTMINMDPATDHIWSGAALGDASANDYAAAGGYTATLNHSDGDAVTVTTTSGTITGLQVYRADDNSIRTGSTGIPGYSLDPARFWGIRAIGTATPTYTLVYNYEGNPAVTNEAGLKLVKRNSVAIAVWSDAVATLDTDANTLTITGETGTEYALAVSTASAPLAPSGLTVTAISSYQVNVSWIDNSGDETNFEIERSITGAGGEFSPLATVGAGITSYSDVGVSPYSEYCYRVRATNGAGESLYAGPVCATTPQEGNYALDFGSNNAYVTFGQTLGTTSFTIEGWFNWDGSGITNTTGTGGINIYPMITKGSPEGDGSTVDANYIFGIQQTTNVIAGDFEDTNTGLNHPITGVTALTNGQWYHGALTFNNTTKEYALYLNGNLETVTTLGSTITPRFDSQQHAALATMIRSNGTTTNGYYGGTLDEVRIWNYARTQEEIQATINSQITTFQTGLLARWGLNEGTGTVVNGSAGTTVSGTVIGTGSQWVSPGAPFNISINSPVTAVLQDGLNGYTGTRDTYIWQTNPSTVRSSEPTIVQDINVSDERRSLLLFDLSTVPAGSTIESAALQFYVDTEGQGFNMYRMLVSWDEAAVTYTSIGNRHFAADNVDAESAVNASWPGVDTYTGFITVTIPASTVQDWIDGILPNYGWLMIATHADDGQQLDSRENGTQANNPRLTIQYFPPAVPTISIASVPLNTFSTEPGAPSGEQSYRVSGTNLAAGIVITAPADFEVSTTSGSGFGSSVSLTPAGGTVVSTQIFVRFNRSTAGVSNGIITHISSGATTREVTVSGIAQTSASVTFQEGVGGYAGTKDTYLHQNESTSDHGSLATFNWDTDDGGAMLFGLLRFDDIFGSGAGQVPQDAVIQSATIIYYVADAGSSAIVFEAAIDWAEAVTYDNFGGEPGVQAGDYGTQVASANGSTTGSSQVDVTSSITAWQSNPGTNHGWLFYPTGTDGIDVSSSENTTVANRPRLTVTYLINPPAQPVLVSPGDGSTGMTTSPTLAVTVSDPEGRPLTVNYYGRPRPDAGEDFTIIALPDAQNYTAALNGGTLAMFTAQTTWCVNNQAALNIAYVAMEGDITNDNNAAQWDNAVSVMSILESPSPGIPYGISIGNHDGAPSTTALYNEDAHFGSVRFAGRPYYGGHYGSDNNNNYALFSASGMDYIVINLGAGTAAPSAEVLNWANNLLSTNINRRAIVVNHNLISGTSWNGPGQAIYDALKGNPNLFMMLCGHLNTESMRTDTYNNNTVYTVLSDYQGVTNGGNGWLRLFTFSPTGNTITISSHSPYLGQSDYSAPIVLPYTMSDASSFEHLGTSSNVSSGSTAGITWSVLEGNTEYEWYVTVSNGENTVTGPVWSFTTGGTSWTGATSNDWSASSNWSNGVPGSTTNVTITSTPVNQPVISASTTAECNNLKISTGASLTINAGQALTVKGILSNSGTLNLKSNETSIASLIADGYTNNGGAGTENIELYLTGGGNITNYPWHYISSPVAGLSTNAVMTSGVNPPANDLAAYREDLVASTNSQHSAWWGYDGWDYQYDNGNGRSTTDSIFSVLQTGRGYNYYSANEATRILSGNLNTTNITKKLAYSGPGDGLELFGWNLLGNPFTSGLDWEAIADAGTIPTMVDRAIYFTSNNGYAYYIPGVGTNQGIGTPAGTSGNIPPMQGFFVKANQAGQSITLPKSARINSFHVRYKGDGNTISLIRLKIDGQNISDETVIRLSEKASDAFDSELDAYKFSKTGTKLNLWTTTGTVSYSINSIPFPETETEVPAGINFSESGNFKLTATELQGLDNYSVFLIDKTTGITINLKTASVINFSSPEGMVNDRFIIKIVNLSTGLINPAISESIFNIYSSNDFINIETLSDEWDGKSGSIDLIDMTGRIISKNTNAEFRKNSLIQIPASGYKGLYFVKMQSGLMRNVGKVMIR